MCYNVHVIVIHKWYIFPYKSCLALYVHPPSDRCLQVSQALMLDEEPSSSSKNNIRLRCRGSRDLGLRESGTVLCNDTVAVAVMLHSCTHYIYRARVVRARSCSSTADVVFSPLSFLCLRFSLAERILTCFCLRVSVLVLALMALPYLSVIQRTATKKFP